jgi:hypothetical protein
LELTRSGRYINIYIVYREGKAENAWLERKIISHATEGKIFRDRNGKDCALGRERSASKMMKWLRFEPRQERWDFLFSPPHPERPQGLLSVLSNGHREGSTRPEKCGQCVEPYLHHTRAYSSRHDNRHSHSLNITQTVNEKKLVL